MQENAEAGPSNVSTPGPTLLSKPRPSDQLEMQILRQGENVECDVVAGAVNIAAEHAIKAATHSTQSSSSPSNAAFNTSYTSGGIVNNVNGNIQSQVNHHCHVSPSLNPMHSLSPFNDAPIDRISPCFMGREDDIQAIASAFGSNGGDAPFRYAVWGMPGLGKSQLALSYAHSSFKTGRHTHIIWISATTLDKVNQGFVKVLDLTQHTDRSNPDQGARLTAARLCLERSGEQLKWLVVLDDVTLATLPFLREHLPRQNAHGSILITTRTLDVADALTSVAGQQYPVHELKALSPEQSAKLLLKRAGIDSSIVDDLDSAQKLVKRVGCLPLAVEQAGAYMKRSGLISAGQLETLYDEQGLREVIDSYFRPNCKLNEEIKFISWENSLSTYEEKSVLTTVALQLQRLDEIDPHLLRLLRVLAFFDPESIPLDIIVLGAGRVGRRLAANEVSKSIVSLKPRRKCSLLRKCIGQVSNIRNRPLADVLPKPDVTPADVSVELKPLLGFICSETWLRGALRHLEDLSLARPLYGERTLLHIHDLIQLVLQQRPGTDPLVEDPLCALAATLLCGAFEAIEDVESPQYWPECERFVPHLMSIAKHIGTSTIDFMTMSEQVAWYFFRRGRYDEGAALFQQVLADQQQQLGADHRSTLTTMHHLAALYTVQGVYDKAATLYRRTLAGREQQLGADHPDTLCTVNNFGWLCYIHGNYDAAETFHRRALTGLEQQPGPDRPNTLRTAHALATLYKEQGRYNEAATLFQRSLAGKERQLGVDHPDTLLTVRSLAALYDLEGRYDEAEALYQRAIEGLERHLGADHHDTLFAVHGLARLYQSQGNYDEAETLYQRALGGQERHLGADHPDTLLMVYNLARFRVQQGRCQEAEILYNRALVGRERIIGLNHPDTLGTIEGLAQLYDEQGRLQEAQIVRDKAFKRDH